MQEGSEYLSEMKDRFYTTLFSKDAKHNSVMMTKQKYDSMIEDIKRIKISKKKESTRDYRIVERYDVMTIRGCEKLIEPISDDRTVVRMFVYAEELFEILHYAHQSINHGGRDKMIKFLNALYKNITQAQIKMYLDVCEFCQQKHKSEYLVSVSN
ncbi:KRAB-A domain-containing protein 2 [Trichonephila clavipes]|nr:KRAB-A domain-containing protein 2 [Trichonephila clavipes]